MEKAMPLIGFRFRPTDQELLYFLDTKEKGGQLHPLYPFVERSLFGENPPWKVLDDNDPWEYVSDTKKIIFVFTKLVSLGHGKTRKVRKDSCGTWDGKSVNNMVRSSGKIVGHRKYYTYKPTNELDTKNNGAWMMHEYVFPDNKSGFALCKITVDTSTGEELGKKRKSSTGLDDGGSRKMCKGSGSWTGQESVMTERLEDGGRRKVLKGSGSWSGRESVATELGECGTVNDVSHTLVACNNDQTLQHPSVMNEWEVLMASSMQGHPVIEDYNLFENIASATTTTSYDFTFPAMQESENQKVMGILNCGTHGDILKAPSVGYNMSNTWAAGSSSTITDQFPGKEEQLTLLDENVRKVCEGSGGENEQVNVMPELYEIGDLGDISDENVRKVCEGSGGENEQVNVMPELYEIGDLGDISDENVRKVCEGSGGENEQVNVMPELYEIGDLGDISDWALTDLVDDPKFQIPLVPDEFLSYSSGMQELLVADNYCELDNFPSVTSNDYSSLTAQQTGNQHVKETSAGGTRDDMKRSNVEEADSAENQLIHWLSNRVHRMISC